MTTAFAAITCMSWLVWLAVFLSWNTVVDNTIAALRNGSWQEQADAVLMLTMLSLLAGPAATEFVTPWALPIMTRVVRVT